MKSRIFVLSCLVLLLAVLGSSQAQPTVGQVSSDPPGNPQASYVFTFKTPPLQITRTDDGTSEPSIAGYEASGAPGDPLLPSRAHHIALPPDVIQESVKVSVIQVQTVELDGAHTIAPAPPGVLRTEEREVVLWDDHADSIVDGKNIQVYQDDAYFPSSPLSSVRFDQMRKWRFMSLLVTPLQVNPVTGALRLATEVQIQVTFERAPSVDERQLQIELSDTVMDDRAAELFLNYDQAQAWYPAMVRPDDMGATANYVIITTKAIVAASTKLSSFVAHKQGQGYSVLVVTEDQYGVQPANVRAKRIRQWLIDNYQVKSIQYVLMIGDPTPHNPAYPFSSVGDVPMRLCWPMHRYLDENGNPAGEAIPTDYLYANLTGNWDLNLLGLPDNYCGELKDDDGAGGMSFYPDVYVGRIPVYSQVSGWVATLDSILDKTILYEDSGDLTWRKRALLPMSFSDSTTDGAYLAEKMKSDYLNGAAYDSHTLYQQQGAGCDSAFASSQDLMDLAVRDHWKNRAYGLVTWWGHGASNFTQIGYGSCGGGNLLTSWDASVLNDSRPAIVFSVSCYNGYPENPNNLGYALLKRGAVATISSSRMSGYYPGVFSPNRSWAGNTDVGYYSMWGVVNGQKVGEALYDENWKMSVSAAWSGTAVINWLDFNLYGDPSLSINDGKPWTPNPPSSLTATSTGQQGINLTWTDTSDNELGFVIERTSNLTIAWMQIGTVGINTTSFSDSGLSCGAHLYYRVHAYNAYGSSGNSNQADAWSVVWDAYEPDNTYPAAQSITLNGLGMGHTFHTAGDVDWTKFAVTAGMAYTLTTYSLDAANDTVLELYAYSEAGLVQIASNDDCTMGSPASCINKWIAPTTGVYYIKVRNASGQGGCSGYVYRLYVEQSAGLVGWPIQPGNLTATPASHCQVNLAWADASNNEDGFEVERWGWQGEGIGTVTWYKIATVGAGVTHYSDTGLRCNTPYTYRVRAYNASGKSLYSNTAQGVTFTADAFEADNAYAAAHTIAVNGTPQAHNFHTIGDRDWVKFSAVAGRVYTMTTSNLGAANDTVLELYAQNGTMELEWNDDGDSLAASIKEWTAPATGTYYVLVRNFHGAGGCPPDYQYTLAVTGTPSSVSLVPPSEVWVSNASVLGIQWAWRDPNSGDGYAYQVERRVWISPTLGLWRQVGIAGPQIQSLASASLGNFSFADTGLTCNTTYDYRIRAFDALGDSAYSEIITATTPQWDTFEPDGDFTQAPTIYVNTSVQDHNLGPAMDYDWVRFTATAREVYTITTSQFTHSDALTPTLELFGNPPRDRLVYAQQCGGNQRSLCINGWTSPTDGDYYIRVSGQGGCPGHDYALAVVDSHVSVSRPAPPTGFTGRLTLPDQLDLSWADNSDNEQGFRIEQRLGVGWLQVANLTYNLTSYRDADLPCGQPHDYRVFAYNVSGNSASATFSITTPACVYPVAAPTSLTATASLPLRIVLAWTDNSDNESGFKIERSLTGVGSWTQVHTTTASIITYIDARLAPQTNWFYRVRGYNATGGFAYSNVASAKTGYQVCLPLVIRRR